MDDKTKHLLKVLARMADIDMSVCTVSKKIYDAISLVASLSPEVSPLLQSSSMAEGCAVPRLIKTNEMEMDCMSVNYDETGWLSIVDVPDNPGYVHAICDLEKRKRYETIQTIFPRPASATGGYSYLLHFPYICVVKGQYISPAMRRKIGEIHRHKYWNENLVTFMGEMFLKLAQVDGVQLRKAGGETNLTKTSVEEAVTFSRNGFEKDFSFIIDMAASLDIGQWPAIAKEWTERRRKWPSHSDIQRIAAMSCHIVPKTSPLGDPHKECRYSFSLAELELIHLQTPQQRRIYMLFKFIYYMHIKDHIQSSGDIVEQGSMETGASSQTMNPVDPMTLVKLFVEQHGEIWQFRWMPPNTKLLHGFCKSMLTTEQGTEALKAVLKIICKKNGFSDKIWNVEHISNAIPGLHSFSLKTVMMFFCEQHDPSNAIWRDENIFIGIKKLLLTYKGYIEKGCIPNYFIISQNIIERVPKATLKKATYRLEEILGKLDAFVPNMEFIDDRLNENALLKELIDIGCNDAEMQKFFDVLQKVTSTLKKITRQIGERENYIDILYYAKQTLGNDWIDVMGNMDSLAIDAFVQSYTSANKPVQRYDPVSVEQYRYQSPDVD